MLVRHPRTDPRLAWVQRFASKLLDSHARCGELLQKVASPRLRVFSSTSNSLRFVFGAVKDIRAPQLGIFVVEGPASIQMPESHKRANLCDPIHVCTPILFLHLRVTHRDCRPVIVWCRSAYLSMCACTWHTHCASFFTTAFIKMGRDQTVGHVTNAFALVISMGSIMLVVSLAGFLGACCAGYCFPSCLFLCLYRMQLRSSALRMVLP